MAMRRTTLIVAILAILGCGLASVPAQADSVTRDGGHCVTVHSDVGGRTGSICAYVDRLNGTERGEVAFTADSGTLSEATVTTLELLIDGQVTTVRHNVTEPASGLSAAISNNWWDEPFGDLQAGAYHACMIWMDGDRACTGSDWLYSQPVQG
jgi:hypothetical protein